MNAKRADKQYSKEFEEEAVDYPVSVLCLVMQVSTSAYYAWLKRPGTLITAQTLHL